MRRRFTSFARRVLGVDGTRWAQEKQKMKITSVTARDSAELEPLLELWEASVRATHTFLSEEAILEIKPKVIEALAAVEKLVTAAGEEGVTVAFMGADGDKIEMLFVAPGERGRGYGKMLVEYGKNTLGCRFVDVNEQNPQATGFYEKMGFRVKSRSELDGQGNPYPILHMEL